MNSISGCNRSIQIEDPLLVLKPTNERVRSLIQILTTPYDFCIVLQHDVVLTVEPTMQLLDEIHINNVRPVDANVPLRIELAG